MKFDFIEIKKFCAYVTVDFFHVMILELGRIYLPVPGMKFTKLFISNSFKLCNNIISIKYYIE
jgi:hypothetical protein